jgi:thioredoxin 1
MALFGRSAGNKADASGQAPQTADPRHVTGDEFDSVVLHAEIPTVVDFWAEWCGPCHAIAPAVSQLAAEFDGRALVVKVDADECPEILERYGIMGIPTLIYFKGGREVDRIVGLTNYKTLKGKLEKQLQAPSPSHL